MNTNQLQTRWREHQLLAEQFIREEEDRKVSPIRKDQEGAKRAPEDRPIPYRLAS